MKEIRVLCADKRKKTLAANALVHNFLAEDVQGGILSGQNNVLMKDGFSVDKKARSSEDLTRRS